MTEPGSVVRYRTGSLIVTRDQQPASGNNVQKLRQCLLEVEPHHVEIIGLVGRSHITARAVRLCLDQGIAVFWMTRNGKFLGRLVPELSRTADLRLRQFRKFEDGNATLELSKMIVAAKIGNASAIITAVRSNRPGNQAFGTAISYLESLKQRAKTATAQDKLLGIEGEAARRYFQAFGMAFNGPITFSGRVRRPPTDPANALLSFGYTLLTNLMVSLLEARGFDPYFGALHSVRSGRPSLALDMIEELRHPVVDRFVLRICNRRELLDTDFEDKGDKGLRLTKDGLRRFLHKWESYLDAPLAGVKEQFSVERVIQRQVERLAAYVRGTEPYMPFRIGDS